MWVVLAAIVAVTMCAGRTGANERSMAMAGEARRACEQTDLLPGADRQQKLDHVAKTIELAEAAVRADPEDGQAHFALFCGLAKQVQLSGLSWRAINRVRRVNEEIARSEALLPTDPDVLVAKGELLRQLPRPLGGDRDGAVRTLKRAIAIKPDHVTGRIYLARALADQRRPEARTEAYQALALAKRIGTPKDLDEAEELLASLKD
jgi:tetratricopeptide (TPR) repeat protein